MFPYEYDDEEELNATSEEIEEDEPVEFGVDFETGKLTGGKVRGSKAVAVWAWNALKTYRYNFESMPWEYGCSLMDLVGLAMSPMEMNARSESLVREALSGSPYIEDIKDYECKIENDKMTISFTLVTAFGEEDMNVSI